MDLFDFHLPTKVKIGTGMFGKTGELVNQMIEGKRIFIITDRGLKKVGIVDQLIGDLNSFGFVTEIFDEVRPNPKDEDCIRGGLLAKDFNADCILALGGGSVIDSAKTISILQQFGGRPQDYAGLNNVSGKITPIVAIPTTAGTGAEVTRSSVITDTEKRIKITIKDVKTAPVLSIIDPELTYGLPAELSASTGMDALVHAIEAYTCKLSNPIADGLALQAMKHIYPNLRKVVQNGKDKKARYHVMIGSTIAGMAFSHADVASVHCMAEAIGGLYDTPHGVANSMFLPYIIEFNNQETIEKHAIISQTIGIADSSLPITVAADRLVKEMKQLAADIGIPSFSSLEQVKTSDFRYLAESAFQNGSTPSNARNITREDYFNLFIKAYNESI